MASAAPSERAPVFFMKHGLASEYERPASNTNAAVAGAGDKKKRKTKKRVYKISTRKEKSVESLIEFFRARILIDEQIRESPDGPYTWLIKERPGKPDMLVSARTVTRQELGTLHLNLDQFSAEGTVVAAGELVKKEDIVAFNLMSGTFMRGFFKQFKSRYMVQFQQEKILTRVAAKLKSIGFEEVAFLPLEEEEGENEEYYEDKNYLAAFAAGQPILDYEDIITRMSNILEYDKVLSGENLPTSESDDDKEDDDD
jgi:hypothetical protein